MKVTAVLLGILAPVVLLCEAGRASGSWASPQAENPPPATHYVDLSFAQRDDWTIHADTPWWSLIDIREVLNLFHPLVESRTGASAGASRQCVIPADWQPPFLLRFHAADNYFADPDKHKIGNPGTESYFDHRVKQVLIDEQVVWERDVVDDNMPTSPADFEVDVTASITPGKPFRLSLRVLDKTSTLERNDRDVWFIAGTWYAQGDARAEQPPRFHTAVWFADPVIGEAAAVRAAPAGTRPHEVAVQNRHERRWPTLPPSKPLKLPTDLALVCPAVVPASGFPLTCGVPLPPSLLPRDQHLALRRNDGFAIPVQSRAIGWWPDGSVRWLLVDAVLPAHSADGEKVRAVASEAGKATDGAATDQLAIREVDRQVTIDTGPLHASLGRSPDILLDCVRIRDTGTCALTDVRLRMKVKRESADVPVVATTEQTRVVDLGPVSACVESVGCLTTEVAGAPAVQLGRFTFRLQAYVGLPVLRASIRVYNDTRPEPFQFSADDAPLEVTDLAVTATLPGRTAHEVVFGSTDGTVVERTGADVSLRQESADHFAVLADGTTTAAGQQAQGWIAASGPNGCVQVSLWRFWQQAPKSLAVADERLTIGLFTATETSPAYRPRYGEAKRHDLWFTFSPHRPDEAALVAWGQLADEPPRLFDGPWFCHSGAIELLDPNWLSHAPELAEWIRRNYGDVTCAAVGNNHWGLRDFGDFPYGPPLWRNGYYARILGAVHWGLASGDQRWLERSFEMARHIADVDTVHVRRGQSDYDAWDGMTCAIGEDHSNHGGHARWSAFMAADQLICHSWLTGDPDSRTDALAGADYLLRQLPGVGSLGVREGTRPLLCLLRAWEATGDAKYLDGARKYCDRSFLARHAMDWRRGTYICPLYENLRIISAGQDAMYADAVYKMYRSTGELDYAQIVVAIADSVYAESMLPQETSLGDFLFYPRYGRNSWYFPQMAVLFCQAYDLTEDLRFLRAARAASARYLLCTFDGTARTYQTADNFGYIDPVYAGWAASLHGVPTESFTITSMVSDPDPANFLPKE